MTDQLVAFAACTGSLTPSGNMRGLRDAVGQACKSYKAAADDHISWIIPCPLVLSLLVIGCVPVSASTPQYKEGHAVALHKHSSRLASYAVFGDIQSCSISQKVYLYQMSPSVLCVVTIRPCSNSKLPDWSLMHQPNTSQP